MAMLTFVPPIGPSPGTSFKPQVEILSAEFGDGYSQPMPDGINHIRKTVSLKWDALTLEQIEAIIDFIERHAETKPFRFRPYGERTAIAWTCREWTKTADGGVWQVTATLVQCFTAAECV